MEKLRCKCVKGLDGFTWGEVYDVEFAGRVWWAVNDDGKKVSGSSESFDPIEEPISNDLEEAAKNHAAERYRTTRDRELAEKCKWSFKAGAEWQKNKMMEDAIKTTIKAGTESLGIFVKGLDSNKYSFGDKVKLIIIKQEEK